MGKIVFIIGLSAFLFIGCAQRNAPEYSGVTYQQIKRYEIGKVEAIRPVVISDNGKGTFLGALVGAVLGSTVGRGNGNTLATLAGGLGGAYVGSEANRANAQELSVRLDNGEHIVVVTKGDKFLVGDRVKIIKEGNRVDQVYRVD